MTEELTALLNRIEALDAAATPGKWSAWMGHVWSANNENIELGGFDCCHPAAEQESEANAELCAEYRTLTPALASALRLAVEAIEASNRSLNGIWNGDFAQPYAHCDTRITANKDTLAAITAALDAAKGEK